MHNVQQRLNDSLFDLAANSSIIIQHSITSSTKASHSILESTAGRIKCINSQQCN